MSALIPILLSAGGGVFVGGLVIRSWFRPIHSKLHAELTDAHSTIAHQRGELSRNAQDLIDKDDEITGHKETIATQSARLNELERVAARRSAGTAKGNRTKAEKRRAAGFTPAPRKSARKAG